MANVPRKRNRKSIAALAKVERFRARVRRIRKDAGGMPDNVVVEGWNNGNAATDADRPGHGIARPRDT